jgi:hypothetical protein
MKHSQASECKELFNRVVPDRPKETLKRRSRTRRKRFVETGSLWQKVAKVAMAEASYQPLAEKVRFAKAAFATTGFYARHEAGGAIQQLYDSFSEPPPAGIRSSAARVRQMLYRADPYQIDLQIELLREQNRFVITGQLVDLVHPEFVGREVEVMLSDGREEIVYTVTNQFGEFRGEITNSGDLEISFFGRSGKPVAILLRGAFDPLQPPKE